MIINGNKADIRDCALYLLSRWIYLRSKQTYAVTVGWTIELLLWELDAIPSWPRAEHCICIIGVGFIRKVRGRCHAMQIKLVIINLSIYICQPFQKQNRWINFAIPVLLCEQTCPKRIETNCRNAPAFPEPSSLQFNPNSHSAVCFSWILWVLCPQPSLCHSFTYNRFLAHLAKYWDW